MTTKTVTLHLTAVLGLLCCWSLSSTLAAPLYEDAPQNASATPAVPAVNPEPDLTPSGYTKSDPLYNDPEVKLGREASDDLSKEAKFCQDKAIVARVQAIGAKIAAVADVSQVAAGFGNDKVMPYHYSYHVIDSKEVNAFSLPGGFIYIYKGMLDLITSDDELAGVLGHETAHAAHHHVSTLQHEANKMSSDMLLAALVAILGHAPTGDVMAAYQGVNYAEEGVLNNVYSEHAEEDADHTGMIFMEKAGYNPVGMLTMLSRLHQQELVSPDNDEGFLQDHPLTTDRVAAAKTELAQLGFTVDAATVRAADNQLPVAILPSLANTGKAYDLTVSSQPVATVAGANHAELVAAANELNSLLDRGLQGYEVKANGASLVAGLHTLITFTDEDAEVAGPNATPKTMATNACKTLQTILWAQVVTGVDP